MAISERTATLNLTSNEPDLAVAESERNGERPQILGKGSLKQIEEYCKIDPVSGYELYIPAADLTKDPNTLPHLPSNTVVGAHNLMFDEVPGHGRMQSDLSDTGEVGDFWEDRVRKTVDLVARYGGSYVTTHIGQFDPKDTDPADNEAEVKRRVLTAAGRINRLNEYAREKGITMVVENDPLWVFVKFGQGILADPQSLRLSLENTNPAVRVILDEEHMYRAAAFKKVQADYLKAHHEDPDKERAAQFALMSLRLQILEAGEEKFFTDTIKPFVEEMVQTARNRLWGLHECGWDFAHDSSDLQEAVPTTTTSDHHLPLTKAPIVFESKTTGQDEPVKLHDLIDHAHTFEAIINVIGIDHFKKLKMVIEHDRQLGKSKRVYFLPDNKTPQKPRSEEREVSLFARRLRLLSEKMIRKYAKASV